MDLPAFTTTDFLLISLLWVNLANFFFLYFSRRSKKTEQNLDQPSIVPVTVEGKRFQFRRSERKKSGDPFYANMEYLTEKGGEEKK